jgi:hypothetical protein
MDILKDKSTDALLYSLSGELAKADNELKCCFGDLNKIQSRFELMKEIVRELKGR